MAIVKQTKYISVDPEIQSGEPCIKGTRIPVYILKSYKKGGETVKSVAALYEISEAQVRAALNCKLKAMPIKEVNEYYAKKEWQLYTKQY